MTGNRNGAEEMIVTLTLTEGPEEGKSFEFHEADTFLVGRSKKAHLSLHERSDRSISRTHFILDIRPPRCIITDLDTTNGTYVNSKRIKQTDLEDGDTVKVGKTIIKISIKDIDDKEPVQYYFAHCDVCRKDITDEVGLLSKEEQESLVYTCRECQKKEEEKQIEVSEAIPEIPSSSVYSCENCGSDLSDAANSDGRAAEFQNAFYICPDCFTKKEEIGLDFNMLGDYLILGVLGNGVLGIVYKAVHKQTRRIYAIKRIHADSVRSERACRLFEREILLQSKTNHQNLLQVIDTGRAGITPFFVTEFMPGGDMENLLSRVFKGPVEPVLACRITIQILKGLKELHDGGFIHRDLKPANYLLSSSHTDKNLLIKICGYGLAKSFENAGNSLFDYTKTAQFGGSYMFLPPEQIIDYKHVKPPADLYAVGVSLYYMLCARYSADFPTPLDMMMSAIAKKAPKNPVEVILEDPPIPLIKQNPDLSKYFGHLVSIVDKAVTKDVSKRFQSADEFIDELESAMKK